MHNCPMCLEEETECSALMLRPQGALLSALLLRHREHCERRDRKTVRAMGLDFCELLSSGHGMALVLMDLEQLYPHAQDRNCA